jgi:hypothetical protein
MSTFEFLKKIIKFKIHRAAILFIGFYGYEIMSFIGKGHYTVGVGDKGNNWGRS